MIGDVSGKSVLDLGGGPLLGKALIEGGASRVLLVDISSIACQIAKHIAPNVDTIVLDAISFLESNKEQFDITIAMGLLEYLPSSALASLLRYTPSPELVINMDACEGYMLYETRTCVYSHKDVTKALAEYSWEVVKQYNLTEHTFGKYRRIK